MALSRLVEQQSKAAWNTHNTEKVAAAYFKLINLKE